MAPRADRPRRPNSTGLFLRWHRYLGLTAAIFVLLLAVTGWLLNHTDALALNERYVKSERLLSLYGIGSPAQQLSFFIGGHWISQLDAQLYFDTERLPGHHESLVGALALPDRILVATRSRILLLTPDGTLIEAIGPEQGVPGAMAAIASLSDNRLAVRGSHGTYLTDPELLRWRHTTSSLRLQWVQPTGAPPRLQAALLDTWRGSILSWERVLLDLHSGRILGRWGPWLVDAAGLVMLLLALSGGYLWWTRRPRRRS